MRQAGPLTLLGFLLLGACAKPPPAAPAPAIAPAGPGPVSGIMAGPAALPRPGTSYGTGATAMSPVAAAQAGHGDVTLDFAATDIRTAVDQILGDILRVNYTIDPAVTGTVTFHTATPLPRAALLPVLQTLLAQDKAMLVQANGLYRVMPAGQAFAPTPAANDALGGAVILPLHYASAAPLAALLQPYVPPGGALAAAPDGNALLIQGDPATRNALASLARAFDVDALAGQSYRLFPVPGGGTRDFAAAFSAALARQGDAGAVTVLPLERIGAVLVITRAPRDLDEAARLYALLRQSQTARRWYVFYLRSSSAGDAAYLLQQAFAPDHLATQAAQANAPDGTDATGTSTQSLQIVPDTRNNAVLVYATPQEDGQIEAVLAGIDIMPVQVRIDATIAEVQLSGPLQYGTQFFFKSGAMNAVLSTSTTDALATRFPGFVLSGHGSDAAPVAISALQSVTKVRMLSAPELTVLNGQPASLQVGELVPYLTQTSQSTVSASAPTISSIDYQETGVILRVTPHAGDDGLVSLDIAQEVSGVASTTTDGINSPTFTDRAITSRIAIEDGQTLALAGVISDDDSHENQGIPYLKNLPLLGSLFSTQDNERTREEMLVLITPHVLGSQQAALALTADMREQFADAALVPSGLRAGPADAAADPNAALSAMAAP